MCVHVRAYAFVVQKMCFHKTVMRVNRVYYVRCKTCNRRGRNYADCLTIGGSCRRRGGALEKRVRPITHAYIDANAFEQLGWLGWWVSYCCAEESGGNTPSQ